MRYLFFPILLFSYTLVTEASVDSVSQSATNAVNTIVADSTAAPRLSDTSVAVQPASLQLCTLEITTDPADASVMLDGKVYGNSPVTITAIDTGRHTLLLQKNGYFQKKAVITLSQYQKTTLAFQLAAPCRLMISSVPDSAQVVIGGELKGATPYLDSLLKPGTYHYRISKAPYISIEDSVVLRGGDTVNVADTLLLSKSYSDSVAVAGKAASDRKRFLSLGVVGSAFCLFLLTIWIIDWQER